MMDKAVELVDRLVKLDPSDPLKLRAGLDAVRSGGLPIVELGLGLGSAPCGEDRET
jgi:hypothetical protein